MKKDDLVMAALLFLGKPYVWGGESIQEGGYDCSGVFYAAMIKAGNKIPRLSAQGYYDKYIDRLRYENPERGDILFFGKNENKITHMGIAVSSTEMIESIGNSKNTKYNPGPGVRINKINRRNDLRAIIDIFDHTTEYYYPKYTGKSNKIDEVFGAIGAPYGSVSKRKQVAIRNGYKNYTGSYIQNMSLIKLAKCGLLKM